MYNLDMAYFLINRESGNVNESKRSIISICRKKEKQKIIDQYDRTLERINLSKGFESLISLMGDREMLLSIIENLTIII